MATEEQRARRRAQRQTASRVRSKTTVLPKAFTAPSKQARIDYGYRVLNGEEPRPAKRTLEGQQLARLAGLARWNKADPVFLVAFADYFYHDDAPPEEPDNDEADEYYAPDEDDE